MQTQSSEFASTTSQLHKAPCLDVLKAWSGAVAAGVGGELESPTSTLSSAAGAGAAEGSTAYVEFVTNSSGGSSEGGLMKEEGEEEWKQLAEYGDRVAAALPETAAFPAAAAWGAESEHVPSGNFVEKFTDLLLSTSSGDRRFSDDGGESDNGSGSGGSGGEGGGDYYEDNKNYWNSILNLVNASPSDSPIF